MQRCSYLPAHPLDTPYGLNIYLLWRELYSSVTRMNTSKLYMLGDGIGHYLAIACYGIHLYFLGMLNELAHHHRVLGADIGCELQEFLKLVTVGAYVHGSTGENV